MCWFCVRGWLGVRRKVTESSERNIPAQTSSESQGGRGFNAYWNSFSLLKTASMPNIGPCVCHHPSTRNPHRNSSSIFAASMSQLQRSAHTGVQCVVWRENISYIYIWTLRSNRNTRKDENAWFVQHNQKGSLRLVSPMARFSSENPNDTTLQAIKLPPVGH